ncbi:MAG TPA: amidohydrolase family protein [Nitrososphaeraceae archaeon]|nr:amidohydrolase family protein [Nitrososphaeraceae archaeon]
MVSYRKQNLLWELKVADSINKNELKNIFSSRQLIEMVTINPAQAIGFDDKIGRIAQGYLADLIVFDKIDSVDPYHNLIVSHEKDLKLSIINGHILYHDIDINQFSKDLELPETITIESKNKKIDIFQSKFHDGKNTFEQVHSNLKNALYDLSSTAQLLFEKLRSIQKNQKPLRLMIEGNDDPRIHQRAKNTNFNLFIEESFGVKDFSSCNLDSLTTPEDDNFFVTINNNPNIPSYLKNLKYYVR